jgi:hypothetical protein
MHQQPTGGVQPEHSVPAAIDPTHHHHVQPVITQKQQQRFAPMLGVGGINLLTE